MSTELIKYNIQSPIGTMIAVEDNNCLTQLYFSGDEITSEVESDLKNKLQSEIDDYFSGKLKSFSIKLNPEGTEFQKEIWELLLSTTCGQRLTYSDLSVQYGDEKAIRAVATANGANPIAILIPCHRIIGKNGQLTGYAWRIERKRKLLQLEMEYSVQHDLFG